MKKQKLLVDNLWRRHIEECDRALEALNQGDEIKFEFYRASAFALLCNINDLINQEIVDGNAA